MLFRHVQRAGLIVTAILAAALFFIAGATLRLTMGPISLGAFSQPIEDALNHAVAGAVIRFDEVVLEWSAPDQRINLIVLGTKIFDLNGHIMAQAPKADLDFDAVALLSGHLRLKNLGLIGLQLTGVRTQDGVVRLGFGRDESQANFLDTLRSLLRNTSPGAVALESISLQHARVAFYDEPTGLFIVLPDAGLSLKARKDGFGAALTASAEIMGSPFHIDAHAELRDDGTPKNATLKLAGFSLRSLSESNPRFSGLKPYAVVANLSADVTFDDNGAVASTNFRADASGDIDIPPISRDLRVSRFDIAGGLDLQKHSLTAQTVSFVARDVSFRGSGAFTLGWDDSGVTQLDGELDANGLSLNLPAEFAQPLVFSHVALRGGYSRASHRITWQQASFDTGPISAHLSGNAGLTDSGVEDVNITGDVAPVTVSDLLRYWPQAVGHGAREWIAGNIPDGRIGPLRIEAALPPGAFDSPSLPDSALTVSFPFQGLTTQYVKGMTPVTRATGVATLRGDSFRATVNSGSIGPIALSAADITIPELHVAGTGAHITAHADGATADILRLIDEPPLGYPKQFGIAPATVDGRSAVDLDFQLPLLKDLAWDQVGFLIKVNAVQLGLPIAQRRLEGANVEFVVNPSSLTARGRGRFAAVPVDFQWNEDFGAAAKSTRLDVTGTADDAERIRLGINGPAWISGSIPFAVTLNGEHFRFSDGFLKADLTKVSADFPGLAVKKAVGVAASGNAQLHFDAMGVISMPDFAMSSENINLRGALSMAEGGRLVNLSLSQFRSGGDDFSLSLAPAAAGYNVKIQGQSLDVRHMTGLDRPTPGAPADRDNQTLVDPISVTADVQKLVISQRVALQDVAMTIAFGADNRLNAFDLQSGVPGAGKLTGHLTVAQGVRNLNLDSDNAGSLIDSLLNFSSVKGGKLAARIVFPEQNTAALRNKTPAPDYEGTVTLSNIVLTEQPFLARLFAAGSLDGPLRLLQGDGISLTKVVIPFRARGNLIDIADGRASGDAIGGSFTGTYDRDARKVDISGTLVPLFGLNSVLGAIPVLGDLLVSKKGEGILGLTYEMKGNIAEPGITVNPLSILTPGILRRLFEFGPSRGQTVSAAPPASK